MADSASTLEIQQRRAFDANTFAQTQAQQANPTDYIRRQTSGVGLDSLQSTTNATPDAQAAPQAQKAEADSSSGPIARLQQIQKMRQQALAVGKLGTSQAIAVANASYTRVVNTFQSELIANVLALEVIVSPWLFLAIYFMRVLASLLPLRVKGITIFPPYSLRGAGGIGVAISHTTAALVILIILFLILFFIMFLVWAISEGPITQTKLFIELSGGVLKALWTLITGG